MKKSERIMGWLGAGASVYLFFNVPEEACRAVLLPFVFLAFIWVLLEAASAQQSAHLTAGNVPQKIDYIRAFGLWHYITQRRKMWFRRLFNICPDCDMPRWWKPSIHKRCIPF